jgi:MoaA/NifB/PqqE/SkfB family radical SAM enzyme
MGFNINQNEYIVCTAGYNYFHVYPNGDIYRCGKKSVKGNSLLNVKEFRKNEFLEIINKNNKCNVDKCDIICDRDWAKKFIYYNDGMKIVDAPPLEAAFGFQQENNFTINKVNIIWTPGFICNYNCEYCSCEGSLEKTKDKFPSSYPELSDAEWFDFFSIINNSYEGGAITIGGGEPFLKLDLIYKIIDLLQQKFHFCIATNLSFSVLEFVRRIAPRNILLCLSLHPSSRNFNFDLFLGRAILLKRSGFSIQINYVAYPEQMYLYDRYKRIFDENEILIDLIPWVGGNRKNTISADSYTKEEKVYVNERARFINRKVDIIPDNKLIITEQNKKKINGAFFYPWYEKDNWEAYIRKELEYPNTSIWGEYSSTDYSVFEKQCSLAKENGIDFFSISWCRKGDHISYLNLNKILEIETFPHEMKFCLLYETGHILYSETFEEDFLLDMEYIASLMRHKSYLKIGSKPVLHLYITRDIRERDIFSKVRNVFSREEIGDILLFGDEVWWDLNHPDYLQEDKIKLFDAIFAYNMYIDCHSEEYTWNPQTPLEFLNMIQEQYEKYYAVCQRVGTEFIPVAFPRFNDRSIRKDQDKVPIQDNRFFKEFLKKNLKFKNRFNMQLLTSWNEWYDDTQLEPMFSKKVRKNIYPVEITCGIPHYNYEDKDILLVKNILK